MTYSPRGVRYIVIYLMVVTVAALPVMLGAGKFAGVYVAAVTLPWSLLAVLAIDAIDPKLMDHWYVGASFTVASAALNSAILYRLALPADRKISADVSTPPRTHDDA